MNHYLRILFALFFFVNKFANANNFEETVYFNLSVSEKHGFIRCRPGGNKLKADYHLKVIRNEPNYTILGNLVLNGDILGNVAGVGYCNEGKFILRKSIRNREYSINLSTYLVETYLIKGNIYNVVKVELPTTENYLMKSKFVNEAGQVIIKKGTLRESG